MYLLVCLICDPDGEHPMVFNDPGTRGRHASGHSAETGHTFWDVVDR
jgi:hypothetical protein